MRNTTLDEGWDGEWVYSLQADDGSTMMWPERCGQPNTIVWKILCKLPYLQNQSDAILACSLGWNVFCSNCNVFYPTLLLPAKTQRKECVKMLKDYRHKIGDFGWMQYIAAI